MTELLIRARRAVVDDAVRPAVVHVSGGVIVEVGNNVDEPPPAGAAVVELADDEVLLPGLVDTHVHVNEPGRTHWEGFATATSAARAGGVTTLLDMPLNSLPPTLSAAALDVKRSAAVERCQIDVGFWGGAVPDNLADLPGLFAAGVFGVKCFLQDSGVPEFPPLDDAGLLRACELIAGLGGLLAVHAEDPAVLGAAPAARGRDYLAFVSSRPPDAEAVAIERVVAAAAITGCRVHIVHTSSAAGVEVIGAAKRVGVPISAETCPHYLTLDADEIPDGAPQFKCCPPIRDGDEQDALWAGLVDGVLDIVVSDHSPAPPEVKLLDTGDVAQAWGGIASVQFGLPVMWTAAQDRGVDLATLIGWMSKGPADLVGLPRKGRIAVGADADLAVFAPDVSFVVAAENILHRHPVTPYLGRKLQGVVRRSWLRGRDWDPAVPAGQLLAADGNGAATGPEKKAKHDPT